MAATSRNKTKLEVLRFVEGERGEVTTSQVADFFEMEIHNARMQLQRYWKTGLLNRRVVDRITKKRAYKVSLKGIARLKWLEKENTEPSSFEQMTCKYPRL